MLKQTKVENFLNIPVDTYTEQEYITLVEFIKKQASLYYNEGTPEIIDADYDALISHLEKIETIKPHWINIDPQGKTSILFANSPTQKIGSEINSGFSKFTRSIPMLSLENVNTIHEFIDFDTKLRSTIIPLDTTLQIEQQSLFDEAEKIVSNIIYHCEPKFDGLAIELIYKNGALITGATRGDGFIGEDITNNIKTIQNIPHSLLGNNIPTHISIRGEVILPVADFYAENEELEQKGEKLYANPRNLAAGTLRQKDPLLVAKRNLKFFPYNIAIIEPEDNIKIPTKQDALLKYFITLGFEIPPYLKLGTYNDVIQYYNEMLLKRGTLPFDIDGLAIKVNDRTLWETLGATSKYPRYAVAFKFPPSTAITQVEDIVFQVGRTGTITPVANLIPINIGGVMVKRATLHNAEEIERLNIAPKDWVEVLRAGDVIPKIIRVTQKESNRPFTFITECPSCSTTLIKKDAYIKCPNIVCPSKQVARLEYLVSRDCLNIEGLGSEWIAIFYEHGIVKNIADIFKLKKEDIQSLPGMGDILPQKIIDAIESKRSVSFTTFLKSLAIDNVGESTAEILAQHFSTLEELKISSLEKLTQINQIGLVTAQSIFDYFTLKETTLILEELFKAQFNIIYPNKSTHSTVLEKYTFVLTGTLEHTTRENAEKLIKSMGGKVTSSVSSKTSYVVAGDNAGSKLKKAQELQIPILNENEFEDFLQTFKNS